jgi:hypothetical protein
VNASLADGLDSLADDLAALRDARRKAGASKPAPAMPERWGLEHLRIGRRIVQRTHAPVGMLDAEPADPAWLRCARCAGSGYAWIDAPGEPSASYRCPDCGGLHDRIRAVRRAEFPPEAEGRILLRDGAEPPPGCTPFRFDRPGVDPAAYEAAIDAVGGGRGALMMGPPGAGKSHLLYGVAWHIAATRGGAVRVLRWRDYLAECRAEFDARPVGPTATARAVGFPGLLCIDDLGAGRMTEWSAGAAEDLIDGRYSARLPVMVTTNLAITGDGSNSLRAAIGDRAVSRLIEMTRLLVMGGADHRETGR